MPWILLIVYAISLAAAVYREVLHTPIRQGAVYKKIYSQGFTHN